MGLKRQLGCHQISESRSTFHTEKLSQEKAEKNEIFCCMQEKKKTCINRVEKLNRKWRRKSLDREGLDLGGLRAKAESWTFS